jgi:cytochrome c55X
MPRALTAILLAAVGFALPALADEPPRARQNELLYLLEQDCGSCHGLRLKGGLGPPLRPADIAGTSDEVLIDAILLGRPGTPMPPWDIEISTAEVAWLVGRLRRGEVAYDK